MLKSFGSKLFIAIFLGVIFTFFLEFKQIQEVLRVESKYKYTDDIFVYLFGLIVSLVTTFIVFSQSLSRQHFIITPTFLFWILFITMVFPGIVLTKETNSVIGPYFYFLSAILFSLGVVCANLLLKFKKTREHKNFKQKVIGSSFLQFHEIIYLKLVLIVSIFSVFALQTVSNQNYFLGINVTTILFQTGMSEFGVLQGQREEIYLSGLGVADYILRYLIRVVLPVTIFALLIDAKSRQHKNEQFILLMSFSFCLLVAFGSGSRMFIMHLLIISCVVYFFYNPLRKTILLKFFILFSSLLVFSTIILGRFFITGYTPVQVIFMSINRVFERIFLTKGVVTSYVFEYFPSMHSYLGGESVLQSLLGNISNNKPLSQLMFSHIVGGNGTAGPQSFGELYANFGFAGVMFCFVIGFLLQVISISMIRIKKISPLKIAYIAYFVFLFGLTGYGKILSFKTYGIHVLLIFIIFNFIFISVIKHATKKT